MTEESAKLILERHGFRILNIEYIPEGNNHYVFDVMLVDGKELIAKFKRNYKVNDILVDDLFGGIVSHEREKALSDILNNAEVKAPKYLYHSDNFVLVEKLSGHLWSEFLKENDNDQNCFLNSLYNLGKIIAKVQSIKFQTYGNIIDQKNITPFDTTDFSDRLRQIIDFRLVKANLKKVFNKNETKLLKDYFNLKIELIRNELSSKVESSTMVITDLHCDNFLVDSNGKFNGFFDIESCQASHPALEFYGLKFFLFNYYDQESFFQAEKAFFEGYRRAGGTYKKNKKVNIWIENILATARMMELTVSYFKIKDGIRDCWSDRFRDLLFNTINNGIVDYISIGNIFREKTGQPKSIRKII